MTTTLTYLGHACFLFETEKAACLIDPWLSPRGAFLGTWRQLPPNDHLLAGVMETMRKKPVAIYVTHEHEDHYDEETLAKILPLAAGLFIPAYENDFLKNLIVRNLGGAPHLLPENEEQTFHDIRFRIFIDESGINRDSSIFLRSNELSFFDGNDCKIFDRAHWLKEQCGPIDIMSSQFSGANMHPICYDMPPEEYKQVSRQKKMRKFVATRNYIRDLAPKYFLPSAGPAVFPYPEHYALNFEAESIFPKWWEFEAYLKSKNDPVSFAPLDAGGSAVSDGTTITFQRLAAPLSKDDIDGMVAYYRAVDAKAPAAAPLPENDILDFFEREMNSKIAVLKAHPGIKFGCPLYFDIKTGATASVTYLIDPQRLALEKADKAAITEPYYLHGTSLAALEKLMHSGKGWGTYFLSFLFRSRRVPDVFDTVMATFFVANDAGELDFGLRKIAGFRTNDEYITLKHDGAEVTCKRFCPHQGADLKYAAFDGRYVTCPRHQWRFDCANGGKADNSDDTIDAEIKTNPLKARQ